MVPDAWDDDWESQADKTEEAATAAVAEEQVKVSKAERLAKHAESNKQLWESAYVESLHGCGILPIDYPEKHQSHSIFLQPATMFL